METSMSYLFSVLVLLVPSVCGVNNSTFIPTNEWQTIHEGQTIPAGLHIRLNLQTGRKEAKLMDKSPKNDLAKLERDGSDASVGLEGVEKRLQQALKNIPGDSFDDTMETLNQVREKYRSYRELKRELESVDMNIKTDTEIINGLMDEYANATKSKAEYLTILEDLDYLVHQIDNALWFIDRGGLDGLVLPAIANSTDIDIKIKSLRLLGALTQNNPKAQVKALEKNCASYLSRILLASTNNGELSAAVYAYGSLLRKFPFAQRESLPKTGMKALISNFAKETADLRTKLRVLTLLCDLMIEQLEVVGSMSVDSGTQVDHDKTEQYRLVRLDLWLHEEKFCEVVEEFVGKNYQKLGEDADILERLLQSLNVTLNLCLDVWSQSVKLKEATLNFKSLFQNFEDDEDLSEISQQAKLVYDRLFENLKFKDEL